MIFDAQWGTLVGGGVTALASWSFPNEPTYGTPVQTDHGAGQQGNQVSVTGSFGDSPNVEGFQ